MNIINIVQAGVISDAPPLSSLVDKIVVFAVSVIGGIALVVIILAGIMYMTSGGDMTRVQTAKKAFVGGIVGLVLAVLAYVIVKVVVGVL